MYKKTIQKKKACSKYEEKESAIVVFDQSAKKFVKLLHNLKKYYCYKFEINGYNKYKRLIIFKEIKEEKIKIREFIHILNKHPKNSEMYNQIKLNFFIHLGLEIKQKFSKLKSVNKKKFKKVLK